MASHMICMGAGSGDVIYLQEEGWESERKNTA